MLRKVFNLVLITFLLTIFASCSKCKDCQISYETLNNYSMSDLNDAASLMGYSNWDAYMSALYPSEEMCDDVLDAAEDVSESTDLDGDGIADYRVYWNCQ